MSILSQQFLTLYRKSESIEIDGTFYRHYDNTVQSVSGDVDEELLNAGPNESNENILSLTVGDVEKVELCDDKRTWKAGSHSLESSHEIVFYSVKAIETEIVRDVIY